MKLVNLAHGIRERGDVQNLAFRNCRLFRELARRRLHERAGPPFLPGALATVPEVYELRKARLQRLKPKAIDRRVDVSAIPPLDESFNAPTGFHRRARRPA